METSFRFRNKEYSLQVNGTAEGEGEFKKCPAVVSSEGTTYQGIFKLTPAAWEFATRKSQERKRPIEEVLGQAGISVLKAELFIRQIPDGFTYVVDHRFFEDL
ncbi:MAG TPA: hypothetical protein VMW38_08425 [Terriglobia bacterium]|nr:hypothetical protein [Terriglobia bacterium]